MTIEELCLEALLAELRKRQIAGAPDGSNRIHVPALGLDLLVVQADASDRGSISVVYEARDPGGDGEGIQVLALGMGPEVAAAAAGAAEQWGLGVLPVLRSWAVGGHVCEVQRAPMIVGVPETDQRFGWTVHLGPVIARAYGRPQESGPVDLGDLSQAAAFRPIFEVIHPLAAHSEVMWAESFAARYFDQGGADATCRVNNRAFHPGRQALCDWALTWPPCGAGLLSRRQFILFEPVPVEQLESKGDLPATLERAMSARPDASPRSPWWRRLGRGGKG